MLRQSIYELFAPTSKAFAKTHTSLVSALYAEAERYLKEDIIGLCLFSWGRGGFKQYYGVLYPIISGDQFEFVLKLTQTKIEYQHLMDIPMIRAVAEEKPPTLQMLPPIEALIG